MNENELRDKAYQIAVEHGWHEEDYPISHWMMLIVTEVAEAVQADRKCKRAGRLQYCHLIDMALREEHLSGEAYDDFMKSTFDNYIKDSLEDELADICIRCYDLAGLRGWDLKEANDIYIDNDLRQGDIEDLVLSPLPVFMLHITNYFAHAGATVRNIVLPLYLIAEWAAAREIPLMWYIKEKMNYNEKRPYKHNRKY